jgi:predicted PurR-regulated permease PerM
MVASIVAGYVVISLVSGNWVRPLVMFPVLGLYWLFLMRMVTRQKKRSDSD